MLGEAVESCQARRPCAPRPTLPSAKNARSQSDGAALGVLPRCADEDSPPGPVRRRRALHYPTPNGAPTYVIVFTSSSTKDQDGVDFRLAQSAIQTIREAFTRAYSLGLKSGRALVNASLTVFHSAVRQSRVPLSGIDSYLVLSYGQFPAFLLSLFLSRSRRVYCQTDPA